MPKLDKINGSYAHMQIVQPLGFQLNGSSAPTVLRDGTKVATASGKLFTVVRTSIGLYTITLDQKTPWPEVPFILPHIAQVPSPTNICQIKEVRGSYSK